MEWKLEEKRPRGRPRKRWVDVVEKNLKALGVQEWKEIVQNGERWRDVVMAAKILIEL
ncbi:Hypothetical protein CINCED_3A007504 [Cinara cedri]|uniref:Uncharacterized protein n=1 Tax=Cinara cedri TaxID=506608 RepID=A0A5E4MN24_9HEMI|nr:Hypothetical protein CINCED_3A007504 [Cinara cedri]